MKQRPVPTGSRGALTPEADLDGSATSTGSIRIGRRALLLQASAVVLGVFASCRSFRRPSGADPAPEPAPHARPEKPALPEPAPPLSEPEPPALEPLPEEFKDGCPACGMGYTPEPSKTFLRHYTELGPEPTSR